MHIYILFIYVGSAVIPLSKPTPSMLQITTIKRAIKKTIDENNPIVLELVSAGYTVEKSIKAVDRCETLDEALNYLEIDEDDEDVLGIIPGSSERQISREDSQGSNDMEW